MKTALTAYLEAIWKMSQSDVIDKEFLRSALDLFWDYLEKMKYHSDIVEVDEIIEHFINHGAEVLEERIVTKDADDK